MKKFFTSLNLTWKNFLLLTIAGTINAIGVTLFLYPVNLYDSGISGTSMLLAQITPEWMTLSVFLVLINFPLFFFGFKRQGATFTIYSLYAVAIYSLASSVLIDLFSIDVTMSSPLASTDLLLCAVFGGLISGVGSGMTIRYGGAIDGVEVMAVIFAKKIGVTVGTFVMGYNVILYVISGILLKSWTLPLYSIIAYAAAIKTVDFIIEGIDRSKAAMIITTRPDEISAALSERFECGTTRIEAKGGFSNTSKTVIYFVVNRFQIGRMKDIVHELDPSAYITISEVADIFSVNNVSNAKSVKKSNKK